MVNNQQLESDEFFSLSLINNNSDSDIVLGVMSANVTIVDNDGKPNCAVYTL